TITSPAEEQDQDRLEGWVLDGEISIWSPGRGRDLDESTCVLVQGEPRVPRQHQDPDGGHQADEEPFLPVDTCRGFRPADHRARAYGPHPARATTTVQRSRTLVYVDEGGTDVTAATFVTNRGSFTATLMPEHAPKTVKNFVDLA